jgi:peptidoglycan/LPS O-acetylase OafA/YrhL
VRGIALISVLAMHVSYVLISGGGLGVDLFFVLSGFLITRLLLRELESTGSVDLARFYLRRAGRLYPALLVALLLAFVLWPLSETSKGPWSDAFFPVAFYYANYIEPDRLGTLIPTWSLAVEEHFYLAWPLFLTLLFARGKRAIGGFLFLLICVSVAYRAYNYEILRLPRPAYTETLSRVDALAIGALAATFGLSWLAAQPRARNLASAVGLLALAAFLALVLRAPHLASWLFNGGYTLVALLSAVLVLAAATVAPGTLLSRVLGHRVLCWFGTRSYGLYLFHMPVVHAFEHLRERQDPMNFVLVTIGRVGVTALIAELSFRFLETPLREWARRVADELHARRSAKAALEERSS